MNYKVVLTETAIEDLRKIARWIAQQSSNIEIAKRFINELRQECVKLDTFPGIGLLPRDRVLKSYDFRFIVYKDYLIFYITDEKSKTVQVMSILNCKQDYMQVMKQFI